MCQEDLEKFIDIGQRFQLQGLIQGQIEEDKVEQYGKKKKRGNMHNNDTKKKKQGNEEDRVKQENQDKVDQFEEKTFQFQYEDIEDNNMDPLGPVPGAKVKTENNQNIIVAESANFENIDELDKAISDMIEKVDDGTMKRKCVPCGKLTKGISHAKEHAKTHISELSFPCKFCDKTFRSRKALRSHLYLHN